MSSRLGVFLPQPSTHPLSHQPLHFSKHFCAISMVEVTDPSPYLSIDLVEDFFGFLPIGTSLCGFTDAFLELATTFRTRFHMGIVSPASGHPPLEPKELEAFTLEVHDSCLLLIELEPPPFQPELQSPQHFRTLSFPAQDDAVIRKTHHHPLYFLPSVDRFIQAIQIQVGQ